MILKLNFKLLTDCKKKKKTKQRVLLSSLIKQHIFGGQKTPFLKLNL